MSRTQQSIALQTRNNNLFEAHASGLRQRHGAGIRSHPTASETSHNCFCGDCPVATKRLLYRGRGNRAIERLDQPFSVCVEQDVRTIGRRIACQYHLLRHADLFEKAALLIDNPDKYINAGRTPHSEAAESNRLSQESVSQQQPRVSMQSQAIDEDRISQEPDRLSEVDSTSEKGHSQKRFVAPLFSEDEILYQTNEPKLSFWDQPWAFRTTCYMLFTAAIVQGWNQTSTNGANTCWLDPLIRDPSLPPLKANSPELNEFGCLKGPEYDIKYGVISTSPFLFGFVGCWLADPANEWLMGRRRAILLSAIVILASAIASAYMDRWWQLLICRALLGAGMGGKAAVVPVFLAEISPTHLRGSLVMNWQVFDALGIFLGFAANLVASTAGPETAWRWQVASSTIPTFALIISLVFISWDSPRFLMKHDAFLYKQYEKKRRSWRGRFDQQPRANQQPHADQHLRTNEHLRANQQPRANDIAYQPEQSHASVESRAMVIQLDPVHIPSLPRRAFDAVRFFYGPHADFDYSSKAFETLKLLRGSELLAAKEMILTHCQLIIQQLAEEEVVDTTEDIDFAIRSLGWIQRLKDLGKPHTYLSRELTAASVVMIAQQLCGINVLIFYSARLFTATAQSDQTLYSISREPLWFGLGIGLTNFIFALPAYWWIESRGRRWLALTTLPLLSLMMALTAASFSYDDEGLRKRSVAACTILFTLFYSPGMGPVPFTLSAELFPLEHRMVGMSLVVSFNFLLGGIFGLVVPLITNEYILLGVFTFTNIVAWILVYLFVREPEMRPLEGIPDSSALRLEEIFQIYERKHAEHFKFQWQNKWDAFSTVVHFYRKVPDDKRLYFDEWTDEMESNSEDA